MDLVTTESKLNKDIQDSIKTTYILRETMREIQEEISSIKRQVDSSSRMVNQNSEDCVDICEVNKSGTILIDSICQEPPILKSKESHFLKKIHVPEKINPMQINYLI